MSLLQKVFGFVEERSRWSNLHAIGNSRLVRASALIPIVGYLILLNDHVRQYAELFAEIDVSWRLILLYIGLSCVGAASMIYALRCPETIKRYRTAVEFTSAESSYFLAGNNFDYVRKNARKDFEKLTNWRRRVLGVTDPDLHRDTLPREEHIIVLMTARWTMRNTNHLASRLATMLLFSTGFLIVGIPSVVTSARLRLSSFVKALNGFRATTHFQHQSRLN